VEPARAEFAEDVIPGRSRRFDLRGGGVASVGVADGASYAEAALGEVQALRTVRPMPSSSRHLMEVGGDATFVDNEVGHLVETSSNAGGVATDFIKWREDDGIGRTVRNGR